MDMHFLGDNLLTLGTKRGRMTAAEENAYYEHHAPKAARLAGVRAMIESWFKSPPTRDRRGSARMPAVAKSGPFSAARGATPPL
jgi:hypothetical protein